MTVPAGKIGTGAAALLACTIILGTINDNDVHYRDRTVSGADFDQASPGMMYVASESAAGYVPVCWFSGWQESVTRQPPQRLVYYNVLGRNLPKAYAEHFTVSLSREFEERTLPAGFRGRLDPACEENAAEAVSLGRVICVVDSVRLVPGREDVMSIHFKLDGLVDPSTGRPPRCPLAEPGYLWLIKRPLIAVALEAA